MTAQEVKPFTFELVERALPVSVDAYRDRALRALPRAIWAYLDGGADDLFSLHQNRTAFRKYRLRQRSAAGFKDPDLSSTMAGTAISLPLALAPTGLAGLMHWTGDIAAAQAAEAIGTRHILSSASVYSMEEVTAATREKHWFQLYPFGDEEFVGRLLARARACGYEALFLTVDTPVGGNREGERINGMGVPMRLTPSRAVDFARHPVWLYNFLRHKRVTPVHFETSNLPASKRSLAVAAQAVTTQLRFMAADLNWDDVARMREQWPGKFYLKGIMDAEDAIHAIEVVGADGVVVSNHGGRQLDGVTSTLDALAQIAPRLNGRGEVYVDGGIRRGSDIAIALCLGARGVFVGRPYLYGLTVHGRQGVENVLTILRDELKRVLSLMGCPSVGSLDRSWLLRPDGSPLTAGENKT